MDLAHPYTAVTPTLEGAILAVLARTTRPISGRDVARLTGRSQAGVSRAIGRLADQGIVNVQEAPPSLLYTLNRDHLLAPAVLLLANARTTLWSRIAEEVNAWDVLPEHLSVFGSAARGDGDVESDIDILVVRPRGVRADDPRWRPQLEILSDHIYRWTGNRAGLAEMSASEVSSLRETQPMIAAELRADAITLIGPSPAELLKVRG